MPGVLNKFFTPVTKMKSQSSRKKIWAFKKRSTVYYFSISTIVDPLMGGLGQISPMPSSLTQPC